MFAFLIYICMTFVFNYQVKREKLYHFSFGVWTFFVSWQADIKFLEKCVKTSKFLYSDFNLQAYSNEMSWTKFYFSFYLQNLNLCTFPSIFTWSRRKSKHQQREQQEDTIMIKWVTWSPVTHSVNSQYCQWPAIHRVTLFMVLERQPIFSSIHSCSWKSSAYFLHLWRIFYQHLLPTMSSFRRNELDIFLDQGFFFQKDFGIVFQAFTIFIKNFDYDQ